MGNTYSWITNPSVRITIGSGHAGWSSAALLLVCAGVALILIFLPVERFRGEVAMTPLVAKGGKRPSRRYA
jgi:uncharacterized protein YsxB (DUF464 family)